MASGGVDALRRVEVDNAAPFVPAPVVLASDPLRSARLCLGMRHLIDGQRTLHHYRDQFFAWDGTVYRAVSASDVRTGLYQFLEGTTDEETGKAFRPNTHRVNNVTDALRAVAHLPSHDEPPFWLRPHPILHDAADRDVQSVANGLLHIPSRSLYPATPAYFATNALPVAFDAESPPPEKWLGFLQIIFEHDPGSIELLQEVFGYLLVLDTAQQKIFMLVGPPRSGKGTIARVLTRLLGTANIAAPTLSSLTTNFGLQPLIGKMLATVTDARIGNRTDHAAVAERLLSVSGEDTTTIDRKHIAPWTGRLPTRFLFLTNEMPAIADTSGALASRFLTLALAKSFLGREDPQLEEKLVPDLPGIFLWALAGLERLRARGHFLPSDSTKRANLELEKLASPIKSFIGDRCIVAADQECLVDRLYSVWSSWCVRSGRRAGTKQVFGRDLRTVLPGLVVQRPRELGGEKGPRRYQGIGIR